MSQAGAGSNEAIVTVVIPAFNKVELTIPCLEALAAETPDELYRVVIVDNASTDGTRALLHQLEGDVQAILNDQNEGFGRACNAGAALATTPYVLFLNNDTEVQPGWLPPLLQVLEQDPQAACVQPRLLYPDGRLNDAGGLVFQDQAWNYGKGHPNPRAVQFSRRRAVDYASGACLLVRKTMFDAVGGFDDIYAPAYYEDTDLNFAFQHRGWKTLYEPGSEVIHVEGGTAGTDLGKGLKQYQVVNRDKFWNKWQAVLQDRPVADPAIIEQWAHRDHGALSPLT